MRRTLHSLMVAIVLLCGLHLGEPAHAHEPVRLHQAHGHHGPAPDADGEPSKKVPVDVIHVHHTCHLATDQRAADALPVFATDKAMLCPPPVVALSSVASPPPTEPPIA